MLVRVVTDKGVDRVKQHVGRAITHAVECQDHHRRATGAGLVMGQHTGAVVSQHTDVIIVSRGGINIGILDAGFCAALNGVSHN